MPEVYRQINFITIGDSGTVAVTRICKHCGVPFSVRAKRLTWQQKRYGENACNFCSRACRAAHGKPGIYEERTCAHCGAAFRFYLTYAKGKHAARNPGKHCSRACLFASRQAVLNRTCRECGALFHAPPTGKVRFCSTACADAAEKRRWRTCPICASQFRTKLASRQTYCSPQCARKSMIHTAAHDRCHNPEWRRIRRLVRERDGNACSECGSRHRVSAHHVIPWRVSHDDSLSNLVTLCGSCHAKADAEYRARFG